MGKIKFLFNFNEDGYRFSYFIQERIMFAAIPYFDFAELVDYPMQGNDSNYKIKSIHYGNELKEIIVDVDENTSNGFSIKLINEIKKELNCEITFN